MVRRYLESVSFEHDEKSVEPEVPALEAAESGLEQGYGRAPG